VKKESTNRKVIRRSKLRRRILKGEKWVGWGNKLTKLQSKTRTGLALKQKDKNKLSIKKKISKNRKVTPCER